MVSWVDEELGRDRGREGREGEGREGEGRGWERRRGGVLLIGTRGTIKGNKANCKSNKGDTKTYYFVNFLIVLTEQSRKKEKTQSSSPVNKEACSAVGKFPSTLRDISINLQD